MRHSLFYECKGSKNCTKGNAPCIKINVLKDINDFKDIKFLFFTYWNHQSGFCLRAGLRFS